MNPETVTCRMEGASAVLTLARPERRNALSVGLMERLRTLLEQMGDNRACRALVLAAEGPVFSSGHDLSEMTGRSLDEYRQIFDSCTRLMETIQRIPQPVVAVVQGLATAAGCQLVATCDLVVAAETASFATPGVKIGLFCTTPMVALTRAIGRKRAMEMLLTGRLVNAREAMEWGLVNRVVEPGRELGEALELAGQVASASPFTIALGKQAFYAQVDLDQPKANAFAKEVMAMNSMAEDAQEGIGAFLGKRAPAWKGR